MYFYWLLTERIYGKNTTPVRPHNAGNPVPYPAKYRKPPKASHPLRHRPQNGRHRPSTEEAVRGPQPALAVLTPAEEAAVILFRQKTLLPLDDCPYALQEAIPHLSRSALHRCLQRHGISRLPPDDPSCSGTIQ